MAYLVETDHVTQIKIHPDCPKRSGLGQVGPLRLAPLNVASVRTGLGSVSASTDVRLLWQR